MKGISFLRIRASHGELTFGEKAKLISAEYKMLGTEVSSSGGLFYSSHVCLRAG